MPTSTENVYDPITGLSSRVTVTSPANTKTRNALTAAAQQARLRSDAAILDFRETAPETAVGSYDSTVTGPEVDTADKYLASLTDQPTLSTRELATGLSGVDSALSARVELMRGVEASSTSAAPRRSSSSGTTTSPSWRSGSPPSAPSS